MRLVIVASLFGMSVGWAADEWHGLAIGFACAMGAELVRMFFRWIDLI